MRPRLRCLSFVCLLPLQVVWAQVAEAARDRLPSARSEQVDVPRAEPLPVASTPFSLRKAIDAPTWLLLEGSQRARYSFLGNQFRPPVRDPDQALSFRTLLTLGIELGAVSFVGELQDSRAYLTSEDSGISTIVVNALEPLQAYVNVRLEDVFSMGDVLELRGGRQTMDLGGRRLIARNRFRNTIQNYTGVSVNFRVPDRWEVYAFGVLPVRVEPSNLDRRGLAENRVALDRESFDLSLWGAFSRYEIGSHVALEAYLFGLHETDGAEYASRNRQLYTPGLRIVRAPSPGEWDVDLENVLQLGTRRLTPAPDDSEERQVLAHFHHAALGYTVDVLSVPRFSLELDYASGDDPLTSGRYERFDSLFGPRRADFGPTGIYGLLGRANVVSAGARIGVKPHARLDAELSWRANWLANSRDEFATAAVRDPSGRSGSFAGNQLEVRARAWVIPDSLRWEVGGAAFLEGPFFQQAPSATGRGDPLFVYTDVEVFF